MIELNKKQLQYKDAFLLKIEKGVYRQAGHKCPCGGSKDVLLSTIDRYGIPLRTVLCQRCGLVRSDPYYSGKTIQEFYLHEYRGIYEIDRKANSEIFQRGIGTGHFINNYLKENYYRSDISGKTIFEIGCAEGGTLDEFRRRNNDTYGCDYDAEYVKYGKRKGLKLFAGGIEKLMRLNKKADIVILCHVLEHFSNPVSELKKIGNLLKENGVVYIAVPGIYFTHRSYKANFSNAIQNAHAFYFTLRTLTNIANMSGFNLIHGDESVLAILTERKQEQKSKLIIENYKNILNYLDKIHTFRVWFVVAQWSMDRTVEILRRLNFLEATVSYYHRARDFFS